MHCAQECRGLYYTPYLVDKLGAATVEQYVFGPHAAIKGGKLATTSSAA